MDETDVRAAIYAAVETHNDQHHRNAPGTYMPIQPFQTRIDPEEEEGEEEVATVIGVAQHEKRRDQYSYDPALQFVVITRNSDGVLVPKFAPWAYGEHPYQSEHN